MIPRIYSFYLFIASLMVIYSPLCFSNGKVENDFSIPIGSIDIYLSDVCLVWMAAIWFLDRLTGIKTRSIKLSSDWFFSVIILFGLFKFFIQNSITTSTIRILLEYMAGYLFLLSFSAVVKHDSDLRKTIKSLVFFCVYIFCMHIFYFLVNGYRLHILSGNFITLTGSAYFMIVCAKDYLKIKKIATIILKILILLIYLMVGHRSGFIAIMLGLFVMFFIERRKGIKEIFAGLFFILLGAVVVFIVTPHIGTQLVERASTTFDTKQETYQGRYNNIFMTLKIAKEYPSLGTPFGERPTRFDTKVKFNQGGINRYTMVHSIVPHNLILEWIYFYGYIGLGLGIIGLLLFSRKLMRFYKRTKDNAHYNSMAVAVICNSVHNLFFALCNVTSVSFFTVFFLFFPVVVLEVVERSFTNRILSGMRI